MALPLRRPRGPPSGRSVRLGKAIFYYLSTVAILVFLVGVYGRFARYARASEDPFPRLDDIGERVLAAARIALTNQQQFDRDWVAGLWHSFVFWGFLTLLIGTTILGIDMDLYRPLTGESFCRRFLPLVLLRDGPDGAAVRGGSRYRHLAALRRPHGPALGPPHRQLRPPARLVALPPGRRRLPHRGRPDPRHLGDAGRQLRDGELRRLDRRPRVRGLGVTPDLATAAYPGLVEPLAAGAVVRRLDPLRQTVPHALPLQTSLPATRRRASGSQACPPTPRPKTLAPAR